ncbi:MAG: flagellar motor switch protein FliN [Calditrichae bacterium]|nr:flagellar motor switch protein FliN [Calditrichota bacterium]MCB9059252.1 flagellar motor switch protein FliN [Calditrichia bacterium]
MIEPDFLIRFYAWMLMDEPAEEITDDHFDALKEGFQQIFGQVKMAVADEKGYFNFTELDAIPAESYEQLSNIVLEGDGFICTYQLTSENKTDLISHYMWPEQPEQFNNHSEARLASTMENEPISGGKPVDIQSAEFGNISYSGTTPGDSRNVNMLLDVELEIRVEIDRKTILVSDLLKLGKGSIVELEKSAGEPLDVYVNGRKFAEGEVVVVDDRFGIRITQLLSPKDRVKSLGQAF